MTAPITCWGIKTDLDLKLEPPSRTEFHHSHAPLVLLPFCYPTPRDETKQDGTMRCRPALNSILFRVNCFLGMCRWQVSLVQRGSGSLHRCRSLRFQSREGQAQASVGKTPRARGVKRVMRCGASRSESRPESARAGMGQEQTQMIIIANGTPIPNAPPTMFANAESKPNPRLNSLRRDMPLPP
jgi:hypothetical protein